MKKINITNYTCDCCFNSINLSATEALKPIKTWGWTTKKVGDKEIDLCNKCSDIMNIVKKTKDADSIKCPECNSTVMRQKCMWELGGDCPRHELSDRVRSLKNKGLIPNTKNVF